MMKLQEILQFNFSVEDIKKSECICLKLLKYRININTPYSILQSLLKNGIFFEDEIEQERTESIYKSAFSILNNIMEDVRYVDFAPLEIAFCIVSLMREDLRLEKWPKCFRKIYNFNFEEFMTCFIVVKSLREIDPQKKCRKSNSDKNTRQQGYNTHNELHNNNTRKFSYENYNYNNYFTNLSGDYSKLNFNYKFQETCKYSYMNDSFETRDTYSQRSANSNSNSEERIKYYYHPDEFVFQNVNMNSNTYSNFNNHYNQCSASSLIGHYTNYSFVNNQ